MSAPPVYLDDATPEDVDALVDLERRSFGHPWTRRNFLDGMGEGRRILVLRGPFAPGEFSRGIRAYCAFELVVDEMHIHDLAVDPRLREHGLGRRLLGLCVDIGARSGGRRALLEVRRSNWVALRLYRSSGFEVVGMRRGYYSRPKEDALLLEKANLEIPGGAC